MKSSHGSVREILLILPAGFFPPTKLAYTSHFADFSFPVRAHRAEIKLLVEHDAVLGNLGLC